MQTWARPPSEFLKLNVDAGFDLDQLTDTTWAVIWDSHGNFVAASNDILDYVHDAMAEAYALRNGIYLALSLGCSRVIVNSNCMDIIETMLNGGQPGGVCCSRVWRM
jgi:hypothetical protein